MVKLLKVRNVFGVFAFKSEEMCSVHNMYTLDTKL